MAELWNIRFRAAPNSPVYLNSRLKRRVVERMFPELRCRQRVRVSADDSSKIIAAMESLIILWSKLLEHGVVVGSWCFCFYAKPLKCKQLQETLFLKERLPFTWSVVVQLVNAMQRNLPQSKEALLKSYTTRLKDDVKSMLENYEEIIKLAKGENESHLNRMTQIEQDTFEMQVRAANIVRAGESLMKLVSDMKQYLILNDFPNVNEAITQNSKLFRTKQQECDQKLMSLRDDIAADLYDLEDEYFTSIYK